MRFFRFDFTVTFLWGLSFPAAKIGLRGVEPFTFLWMRGIISASSVFRIMLIRKNAGFYRRAELEGRERDFWINACLHNLMFIT